MLFSSHNPLFLSFCRIQEAHLQMQKENFIFRIRVFYSKEKKTKSTKKQFSRETGAGSLCNGSGVTSSHASAISDYLGKSVLVVRFPHWVNSIFFIFTLLENHIRWATLRNEEKKYWSFETEKAFKTFSHHRIDLWKVKVAVLFCRVFGLWPLALHITANIKSVSWPVLNFYLFQCISVRQIFLSMDYGVDCGLSFGVSLWISLAFLATVAKRLRLIQVPRFGKWVTFTQIIYRKSVVSYRSLALWLIPKLLS